MQDTGVALVLFMLTRSCVSSANWWYDTPYDSISSPTADIIHVGSKQQRAEH